MSKNEFTIGTRGSLLAVTQCTLLKDEIEQKSGASFNLKLIKTQGDQQTDKALWQLDGKDFFTKELDQALLNNEVDLVVHSYKDLGSERPDHIELACIGKRRFAHDIFLIPDSTLAQMSSIDHFKVGTSSPRRITNITSSLCEYLPNLKEGTKLTCEMLKGNVNTRIQKLRDGNYHGIVLALAGLERLAGLAESKKELEKLLEGMNFLVLPQSIFPSAASQGALAVEISNKSERFNELKQILKSVHDEHSAKEIEQERAAFHSYGGGCHLAVGINVKKHKDLYIHTHKGEVDNKKITKRFIQDQNLEAFKDMSIFYAMGKSQTLVEKIELKPSLDEQSNYFVTSPYCLHTIPKDSRAKFFASGAKTHRDLVKKGIWVCGSADGLGHEEIELLKSSKALQIMLGNNSWKVLSHDRAQSPIGEVIACYQRKASGDVDAQKFLAYDAYYWGSFNTYKHYVQKFPQIAEKNHLCGMGKTLDQFQKHKIHVTPICDLNSLKKN